MPSARIVVRTPIIRSPRVLQVEGMFDMPSASEAELAWDVSLPLEERGWNIGKALQIIAWHEPHHQGQAHITLNLYKAAHV